MSSVGKYLSAAFLNRWNILAFLGGLGFALISGAPDVAIPLVLAAEMGYVSLLGTHPKFRSYVDAQEAKASRGESSHNVDETLRAMLRALPRPSLKRFENLKNRCLELRQIALDLKHPGRQGGPNELDDLQLSGLDRLLWIYLKLLFTEHSLNRFFETTQEEQIRTDIAWAEKRIEETKNTQSTNRDKVLASLQDNLQACQDRLKNYQKARDNLELVQLELDRLENKIRSLSELAVNRQEPDFISGQVNSVASSMLETEKTINDLQFVSGLHTEGDEVPELVRRETAVVFE